MKMKAYIIQPHYSFEESDLQKCFDEMLRLLDSVEDDADIIVLPEYCDVPAACESKKSFHTSLEKYNSTIKEAAKSAATSLSCSVRDLWISSLASRSISFLRFSPERIASLIRRVASISAEPISRSATFFR